MKELFKLLATFMKIGLMTVGGGYAVLPILEKEIVEKNSWASREELANYFAIGQCTPGLIAVNVATFIGNKRKGISGGILATVGFVMPSIVIIICIASLLHNFYDIPLVKHAFSGIRVAVVILIIHSVINMWKSSVTDITTFTIFLSVALISYFTKISPVILVIASALLGIIMYTLINKHAPVPGPKAISSENQASEGDEQ